MNRTEQKNNTTLATVLALSPLLDIYSVGVPLLSLSQLLLVILLSFCYLTNKRRLETYFIAYVLYAIFITIVNICYTPWIIIGDCFHDILSLLLFFFTLLGIINYADYDKFKRVLLTFGTISLVFFFFQYGLRLIGISISGIIPFLPLSIEGDTAEMIAGQLNRDRNSGLFLEPAHYSDFMIIVLTFYLFKEKMSKKDITYSIAIVISILLSQSATGYALMTIVFVYWLFVYHLKKSRFKFLFLSFAFAVVAALVIIISSNEGLMEVFGRYNELSGESNESVHGHSSYIRVMRGYIPFSESTLFHQLFGSGLGSILGFVKGHPSSNYLAITSFTPDWVNGFQYLIFTTGIVGAFLYFSQLFKIGKRTSMLGKSLIVVLIMLFLSANSFFSQAMILYIVVKEKLFKLA